MTPPGRARAAALAAAAAGRAAVQMAAPAPPIAPSPMPQMERTAAEVRARAKMAASKKERERRLSGGQAAPAPAAGWWRCGWCTSGSWPQGAASAWIAALSATGNARVAHDISGGSVPPASAAEQRVTFEDLQARMERIRANAASGTF